MIAAGEEIMSPWHTIPLRIGPQEVNFLCEIPRGTLPKYEMQTVEPLNPIAQDVKFGALRSRDVAMPYNYGALVQVISFSTC